MLLISFRSGHCFLHFRMREWLSGGASPSQGEGRGFESRLALFYYIIRSLKLQDFRLFLYCLIY